MMVAVIGYFADLLFGDPRWIPHPIRFIGLSITGLEGFLRRKNLNARQEKYRGILLTAVIVGSTYIVIFSMMRLAYYIHEYFGSFIEAFLIFQILAAKSLDVESRKVLEQLRSGNLEEARKYLSYIVGRDTKELSEKEVIRAAVETIAENISDGIIAPLCFIFLGGVPLGMAYKAVNTLDSMVGYKNERYMNFGWASARLDDLTNYIPARLTGILVVIAAFFLGFNGKNALGILKRDCRNHSSPNSGYPEAAVAGALEIQIGGTNTYFGKQFYKPTIGEPVKELNRENISQTIKIMYMTSFLGLLLLLSIVLLM